LFSHPDGGDESMRLLVGAVVWRSNVRAGSRQQYILGRQNLELWQAPHTHQQPKHVYLCASLMRLVVVPQAGEGLEHLLLRAWQIQQPEEDVLKWSHMAAT